MSSEEFHLRREVHYSRRILLVLSGMSPQVVTGTLFGILHNPEFEKYHPTEIHLIATQGGKDQADKYLLGDTGEFYKFCQDYDFPYSALRSENVHVIKDRNGLPLQDIRTAEENEDMADFVMNIVRELTSDSNSQLHMSISGGRKTMSYFGGYALTMLGREQDILSHVLVSEEFEFIPEYYYPTPYSKALKSKSGSLLDAKDAKVSLAKIPYVHLRETLPMSARMINVGFKETLEKSKKSKMQPSIQLDSRKQLVICSGEAVKLQKVLFGVYSWLLKRNNPINRSDLIDQKNQFNGQVDMSIQRHAKEHAKSFMSHYSELYSKKSDLERTENALKDGMTAQWLEQKISKINSYLTCSLGVELADLYKIKSTGGLSSSYYLEIHKN